MKIALDGTNWELNNVNVVGTAKTNFYYTDHLSAISNVVDLLGGEIVFYIEIQGNAISGRYMDYLARQGADTSKVFASGSNLLTVERQSDTSNIYTAILPRGKGEEIDNGDADTPDGYGRRINIADVEWKKSSGKPLDKPKGSIVLSDPDATAEWGQINGNARLLLQTYDDIDDVNVLINSAYKTLQSVNHPQIQYSATVADVGGLSLGDTVLIMHGDRDLSYKTRVFEVKYDLLAPDQTELSLGDDLSSNSITSQLNSLNAVADTTSSQTQWTINQIGRPSTTFGNTEPANPKVGDVFFKELPDGGTEIYRWNGDIWELLASPTTADDIATAVTDAVSQAKAHTDEVKQVLSSDIATAKSQAASQASTAEANAKSAATSQFTQAKDALAEAKANLQNDIDESKGNIVEINKTLTGFDGTLQRVQDAVNGLGQTNQLMNTEFTPDFEGWVRNDGFGIDKYTKVLNGSNVVSLSTTNDAYDYLWQYVPVKGGTVLSFSTYMHYTPTNPDGSTVFFRYQLVFYDDNMTALSQIFGTANFQSLPWTLQKSENVTVPDTATSVRVTYYTRGVGYVAFSQPMLVFESTVGAYVQGNYNNNDALAQVKLTADKASLDLSTYKTDANGRISKAQAGVEANATAITQKVSQTDYDKVTGDLSTKLNKTTDTADGTQQELSDYKEYANGNISGVSSDLSKLAGKVDLKLTKTDYDNDQSILNTSLSQWKADYDGWTGTVSKLSDKVNSLGQVNQLFNTEFTPDYQSWTGYDTTFVNDVYTKTYKGSNVVAINSKDTGYHFLWQYVPVVAGTVISFSSYMHYNPTSPDNSTVFFRYQLVFYNDNNTSVGQVFGTANLQSLDWVLQKSENIAVPTGATKVRVTFYSRGAGYAAIAQPMLVFASTVGTYVQGNYNNNAALAQVKITADNISNFVRDSSGNISSDFQTALSKTSIITGSTLASSIQTQTSSQITSALTDNNGKIIGLINQDASGVQIAGKNIVLNGDTTVTGDFYAKGGNFKNLNASNLTVGTLNGTQVNITNINASNIVSGAISGANLNINLNTGSVVFQKGRINSSDYTTDINIDQGYISTADEITRALLTQGKLQLIESTLISPQTNPYLEISNNSSLFNGMAALIKARDSLTVSINGYSDRGYDTQMSTEKFVGLSIGKYNDKLMPTKIGGAEQGVIISGGHQYSLVVGTDTPYIFVGSDSNGTSPNGNRIYINGSYVHSPSTYLRTTSGSANVVVSSDGALVRSSSARKYKLDIKNNISIDDSLKLIDVPLSTWVDKHEYEKSGSNERYFGMIAEDLRDAGLEYLVQYGEDNEVEGINYDRVALLLIPLVKELKERIEELESKGK